MLIDFLLFEKWIKETVLSFVEKIKLNWYKDIWYVDGVIWRVYYEQNINAIVV